MISDSLPNDPEGLQFKKAMIAMVLFGVGEVLGCFFIGYMVDHYGSRISVFINLSIIVVMIGLTLGFIMQYEYNFLVFAMTFMWGF